MKITFISTQNFAVQLEQKLQNNSDTVLDLSNNPLGKRKEQELLDIAKVLIPSPVTTLNLSQTGLHLLKPIDVLLQFLRNLKSTKVVNIDLSGNWLGTQKTNEDLKQIVQALIEAGVEEINFSSNQFGKVDIKTLQEIFTILNQKPISKVYLNGNQFDSLGGAHFVADFLFKTLETKAILTDNDSFTQQVITRINLLHEANNPESCIPALQ
ncbi:hypothetical protein [Legionella hackeliae]|uniref:Leucine-rich repeat-containing protein n=1 Tax=Legionella hackeliae TaxID=449 RepID=A0A0A8UVI4_LEGHA|nr:hypothetical protein [Legionella hackeliae]KTD06658.1 Leucine-rich repeat-and coiled coil-containing protein [Legionella hackeliae]CEK10779.1 protein of unknown function [coiled-coil domain] [Legionella hackeliae]STX47517.1 Leucine-rich repeat-and coiled coil-containing protein Substrate of the Dot/Icm secretion system [Legionella hackeliae]